ncbi:MAG: hypothetical protein ACXVGT_03330 [Oryzihumus sp.]
MVLSYDVTVLGPLPEQVELVLGQSVVGEVGATTVLGTRGTDATALPRAIGRASRFGLELAGLHRDDRRGELEVSGPLGPVLQAAFADLTVAVARRSSVLCLRLPGRTLASALRLLTEQDVDLLSVRVAPCCGPA